MMTLDHAASISLILTVPTVLLGLVVILKWYLPAFKAFKKSEKTATDWLILGVAISFIGSVSDNVYWGIAWGSHYLGHPATEFWFEHGVLSNIPFRQFAGIVAAYCHIRSANTFKTIKPQDAVRFVNGILLATSILGVAAWGLLWFLKAL